MKRFLFLLSLLLLLVSCAGGTVTTPEPTSPPPPTATAAPTNTPLPTKTAEPTAIPNTPTPEPTPTAAMLISSLENTEKGVVRIVAEGTFVDPELGMMTNASGSGSGFIISEDGLAVTNNHVVTGAGLLRVYVNGEEKPRNAKILGASECSDLAVIDIQGDGYFYLDWYDAPVKVGMEVYSAGYPLGDPEFTLTRGIVSKVKADGETDWASVDEVLEHDATINPGNSGGPLVTADGRVVGINYSGNDYDQYFAIKRSEALEIIDELKAGKDVDSIGINGTAVSDGENISGIWVASVKSGSSADKAGVKPGDIITHIENLALAIDGTMNDYCDILRTKGESAVMGLTVLRYETSELLKGQLNGEKLAMVESFATTLEDDLQQAGGNETGVTYDEYIVVTDESGELEVELPTEWSDIDGSDWMDDDGSFLGRAIRASSDLQQFYDTWNTPGMFFFVSEARELSSDEVGELLDNASSSYSDSCTYDSRNEYDDGSYQGLFDIWSNCGDQEMILIHLAAQPASKDSLVQVIVVVVNDADLDALDHIWNSFQLKQE